MTPEARYHRRAILILSAGLAAAAIVFGSTRPTKFESGTTVYEFNGDKAYRVDPADLKRNSQDSWTKANSLTVEAMEWLGSWCRGRRLAYTLAGLSAGGALVCLFLANFEFEVAPPTEKKAGQPGDGGRGGAGGAGR